MNKSEFKDMLAARISPEEAEMLRTSDPGLYISDFNREVCRRIIEAPVPEDDSEVDEKDAKELEESLDAFLCRYMDDHHEAHKWIVLSCLELAFVEGKPMHPQKKAGWKEVKDHYYCPSMEKGSVICTRCACEEINCERVRKMERIFDEANERICNAEEAPSRLLEYQDEIRKLEEYYTSDDWKLDFAIDEAGLLPEDLKRGVLSEDGIYDLLERNKEKVNGKLRQHIVFNGWVQGVGFRYRACHAADYYGATGWVRNEFDGSVTMEIQGTQEQIDNVIMAIERGTYVKIERMDVRTIPVIKDEFGFRAV